MRKRYLLTALLIGLTTLCVQAQNLVPRRTSARQAARVVTSDRFVRTDLPAKTAGQAIQRAATTPVTPDWECHFDKEADFNQFTVIDANNDRESSSALDWAVWNYLFKNGESPYGKDFPDHCAGYGCSEDNDADDWLVTPGLQLKGGATYTVKYKVRAHKSFLPERLEVKYGSAPTVAAMTTTLMAATEFDNTEYKELTQTITVAADQVVYIGFHAVSEADNMILYLDDISVKKSVTGFKGWECSFDKEADFSQFTVIDGNNDRESSPALDWGVWNYLFKSGQSPYGDDYPNHCAGYGCSEENDADDWLITPALSLRAGDTYVVKYKVRAHRSYLTERLEVKYGTAATVAGMTTTLMAATDISNTEYKEYTQTITPTADGDYFIGFHAVSEADNMILYLDDISVKTAGALPPGAVTDLTLTPDPTGALAATLSFKAPAKASDGSDLQALGGIKVLAGDTEIADITNAQIGKPVQYTVAKAADQPGICTYTVMAYNADGNGAKTSVSGWVGLDAPTAPATVTVKPWGTKTNVVWEAAKAEHSGVFVAKDVTYDVCDMRDATTVSSKLTSTQGTTATLLNIDPNSGDQRLLQVGVSAGNTTGTSAYTLATPMVVGAAYKLPFKETFAKAGYAYGFWGSEGNGWGYQMNYAGVQASTTEDANGDGGSAEIKTYYEDCVSLVSGKIALGSASKPVFKYSQKTTTATGAIRVFVIKADGSRDTLATENLSGYADGGKWAARSYNLSAYKDQKWIRLGIAFDQAKAAYKRNYLYIDNFLVANETPEALSVGVSAPAKMRKGHTANVRVAVTNYGEAVSNYTVTLTEGKTVVKRIAVSEPLAQMQTSSFDIAYKPSVLTEGQKVTLTATAAAGEGTTAQAADATCEVSVSDAQQPTATALVAQAAQGKVSLTWTAAAKTGELTDDFEDYNEWSIDQAGDWSFIDGDKGVTYGYFDSDGLYYENEKTPFAYIVWTPTNYGGEDITRANPTAKPASGLNAMGSVYSYHRAESGELTPLNADNWMISPELTGEAQTISFKVNNISESRPENYQVLYSTTGKDPADFQLISEKTVTSSQWDEVSIDLPQSARYFAIRHTTKVEENPSGVGYSSSPYLFLVDDVTMATKGCQLTGYNVYRDGQLLGATTDSRYTDQAIQGDGKDHTYQVTALYADGTESVPVSASVNVPTGIDIIEAGATTPDAVYTLDGRKLDANAPLHRGVYIKNGKKVIVR